MKANSKSILTGSEIKEEFVPQWAKEVVWYQIFPERFRNGDPSNDPALNDIIGASPHDYDSPWQIHPWGSDWYKLQPYERENGRDIWHNILRRRYGGDLQGIIDKLDYLQELGIGAIYLNPVFESPSHHKYDGACYHHIDPNFGPDPKGDRELMAAETPHDPETWVWTSADKLALKLIEEVHARGMRIIFDGVFNHMGVNSFAFRDLKEKQQGSVYKDWFKVRSWHEPENGRTFQYDGWWSIKELPELRQDRNGIVAGPREYIFAATKRWLNPDERGTEFGIDGWRLDVAFEIRHPFWKAWRQWVRSINPGAYLTAEVIGMLDDLEPYLQGDEFDAVMNYDFSAVCSDFLISEKSRIKATEFDERLRQLRSAVPAGVSYVMQNLFDSHDTNRIASHIVNRDHIRYGDWKRYFHFSQVHRGHGYATRKPTPEEYQIQGLFAIFQMTYIGAPMIYFGDEVGMWGANDPCCRKPMVWDDIEYEDEATNPDGSHKSSPDRVEVNRDLLDHYRDLIRIRNEHEALQLGDFETLITDDDYDVYAFARNYRGEGIVVALNVGEGERSVSLPVTSGGGRWLDLLDGTEYAADSEGITLTIPGKWGAIVRKL